MKRQFDDIARNTKYIKKPEKKGLSVQETVFWVTIEVRKHSLEQH